MAKKARTRPMWKKRGPDARSAFIKEFSKEDFETFTRSVTKYQKGTKAYKKMFIKYGDFLFRETE